MPTAPKIIAIVNLKGGCGRSTLSTNLAGELAKRASTALIDCDRPQWTSASWYSIREQSGKGSGLAVETAEDHKDLIAKIYGHQNEEFIVLDSPPRLAEIARAMIMLADLVLIPVAASAAEIWSTGDLLELLNEAKKETKVDARMVWSRHRGNTKLARELLQEAENVIKLPVLDTTIGLRVGYQEALGLGLTGTEVGDSSARKEILSLVDEVITILEKKR